MFSAASIDQNFISSSLVVPEQAAADTTDPILTSLTLPGVVDVTTGSKSVTFSAGGSDEGGSGIDRISILFDPDYRGQPGLDGFVNITDAQDSFADGFSSTNEFISSESASGTYAINALVVYDKAGNDRVYFASELAGLGFATSFQIKSDVASDTTDPILTSLTLPGTVDVTTGSKTVAFSAGASDSGGSGIDRISILFDPDYRGQSGLDGFVNITDAQDSFADGFSSTAEFISSESASGAYSINALVVYDKAGNDRVYFASELASLGFATSFQVQSNVASDTTDPILTSLTLPGVVDVTTGSKSALFSAGASDSGGSGIDRISILFDPDYRGQSGLDGFVNITDVQDSFADGFSSVSEFINSESAAGTYAINALVVYDKAGNDRVYFASELASLGFATSFQIADRNIAPTASVNSPASVIEGNDGSISLSLTLKDVGSQSVNTNVTVSFAADQSTATNGQDANVGAFSGSYSIAQSPSGNYVITLPSSFVLDDLVQEGTETLAIHVTASGQIFDTGTDSTVVRIKIRDNDRAGSSAADTIIGDGINDTLFGLGGNDYLDGQAGADRLYGDAGADTLVGGLGSDQLFGGEDADDLFGREDGDYLQGDAGADRLYGEGGADTLVGGLGSDQLFGGEGADDLFGREDGDYLQGDGGADRLYGEGGDDVVAAGDGDDLVVAGAGADQLFGGDGADEVYGREDGDYADGGTGADRLYGDAGADTLVGGLGTDQLFGGEDADDLFGREDGDYLQGDGGADRLYGEAGADTLVGGLGTDQLFGGDEADELYGREDGDYLQGDGGADRLYGEGGDDLLVGGLGADQLFGGDGADELYGREDADYLQGDAGADRLYGDEGNDTLVGGAGADTLLGGAGADLFAFTTLDAGVDRILDFDRAAGDRIDLSSLDANTATADDDSFRFIGAGAFSRTAGELRFEESNGELVLTGDVNGDGLADFTIITAPGSVDASVFLL